jgi:putative MFS transporter
MSDAIADAPPSSSYLRRLLIFLCLVAFFDGYDLFAISQTLPELRAAFGLTPAEGSRLLAIANLGTIAAFLLVRLADRWGRRPLLLACLAGYSSASLLSGLAPGGWTLLIGQFAVRVFLVSALGMAVLYATEEYAADQRGRVVGIVQACYSLGGIFCAVVTPRLLHTSLGWRAVYLLGAASLALLFVAIPGLRETTRFLRVRDLANPPPLLPRLLPAHHHRRMLKLAAVWISTFLCNQSVAVFWKEYARAERGMSNERIGVAVALAALVALPLTVLSGRLMDRIGRRWGAVVIYTATAVGVLGAYAQIPERWVSLPLILMLAGGAASVALLSAWTAEKF